MTTVGASSDRSQKAGAASVLRVCGATDVGLQREQNQDTFVIADLGSGAISSPCDEVTVPVLESGYLLLVCDGMGGAAAGEVAAGIAARAIRKELVNSGDAVSAHPGEALGDAVVAANRAILDQVRGHPQQRGMGTTCTAAIVLPHLLTVAQVGDSRAYLLRQGKLWSLTKDQSLATQLLDQGVLTAAQVETFPYRHVLVQALGSQTVQPVIQQYQLLPGDRVLLCSDGLHGLISDADIEKILTSMGNLSGTTQDLVARALAAGGADNVTVVLAEYRAG